MESWPVSRYGRVRRISQRACHVGYVEVPDGTRDVDNDYFNVSKFYYKNYARPGAPAPKMNRATEVIAEFTVYWYDSLTYDNGPCYPESAEAVRQVWWDMLEDHSDEYDADWYPLVATPAIRMTINWEAVYKEARVSLASWRGSGVPGRV